MKETVLDHWYVELLNACSRRASGGKCLDCQCQFIVSY